jgi:hypothetical protein
MKIVINDCFGGFKLTDEALQTLGVERSAQVARTDPRLIKMVKEDTDSVSASCSYLTIVEIPDESTDWMIQEYEGAETVFYVLDGKIYQADYAEDEDEEE